MNMKAKTENPRHKGHWLHGLWVVVVVAALSVFCRIAHYSLIIPLFLLFLGIYLNLLQRANHKLLLHLGLLVALILSTAYVIVEYSPFPHHFTPVAGIAMLTMLLFNDLQLAFLMAFVSSTLVSLILGGNFGTMLTFFMGSLTGAYAVRGARQRSQIITGGLFASGVHLVCLLLLFPDVRVLTSRVFEIDYVRPFAGNGIISALLVLSTLGIFEYAFGVLTNFSLIEIADSNHPVLKRMQLEAPGTWQHSLTVAQLAEAAADAVGANPLLTRAGAYYHDIGKIAQSEYFTENQLYGGNKHEDIEPSMSRLVILNHVKEGIELARKNKLNPIIIDFIPQHHGTALMHYFYQKALEEAKEGETVSEENFRYPGPKPQTPETAITLLADSVEGATRALDEPNPTKIEETVRKVVNNKFIDGQLDECNLTLKEIDKICSTFARILSAMYHGRVKYPEEKNESAKAKIETKNGSGSKKSAEKSVPQSSADRQDRQDGPSV